MAEKLNLSNEDYHRRPEISKTGLALYADVPARYKHHVIDGNSTKDTDTKELGSAAHMIALEEGVFESHYYILPAGVKRDKRHKFEGCFNDHLAAAAGKRILREEDADKAAAIARVLRQHEVAGPLLQNKPGEYCYAAHEIEQTFIWTDEETGLECRCKPDDRRGDGIVLDLKISNSSKPDRFGRIACDFMYDLSVAHTVAGLEAFYEEAPSEYVFIVVEPDPPHLVSCFTSMEDPDDGELSIFKIGQHRRRNLLRRLKESLETNSWPGYAPKFEPLRFPAYELKKMELNQNGE